MISDIDTPEDASQIGNSDMETPLEESGEACFSCESEIESLQPMKSDRRRTSAKNDSSTNPTKRRRKSRSFENEYVSLKPQGISVASALGRPVLVLKDQVTGEVLPIWLQTLDASVAVAELSERSSASPHQTARRVIEMLGGQIRRCIFRELIGHHQFAELVIVNHEFNRSGSKIRRVRSLRIRADEAMSFCLQAGIPFFATREFMARSRAIDMDLAKLEYNLGEGLLPELKEELENSSRTQPYMM